jgi:NADH-quinone oxidoreductase subunit K
MILIGIELMLNAANLNFIYFATDTGGQLYVLFIMVLAAAEAAIGLAIIIQMFRRFKTISLDKLD